jgi:D-sedoheptulose 7-phosphate isomerase
MELIFSEYLSLNRRALDLLPQIDFERVATKLYEVQSRGGTVWLAGNGGSGSTASHAQCDLSKGIYEKSSDKIRAICLNDLSPLLSAWENDTGHDLALVKICENFVLNKDLLILFSGSGNSKNICNLAEWANANGVEFASFTGFDGGTLKQLSKINFHVPMNDMQVVENMHLLVIHGLLRCYSRQS